MITAKALANEVAKNLVLAGIGSLTILDHENVTEEDLGAQFFVYEEHIGQNVCTFVPAGDARCRMLTMITSAPKQLALKSTP